MFTEPGSEVPLMNICQFLIDSYDAEIKVERTVFPQTTSLRNAPSSGLPLYLAWSWLA